MRKIKEKTKKNQTQFKYSLPTMHRGHSGVARHIQGMTRVCVSVSLASSNDPRDVDHIGFQMPTHTFD